MRNIHSEPLDPVIKMTLVGRLEGAAISFNRLHGPYRQNIIPAIVLILATFLWSPVAAQVLDCTDAFTADIAYKGGNNGAANCNQFCTNTPTNWGTPYTYCISAWDEISNSAIKCSTMRGYVANQPGVSCYCSKKMIIPCTGFRVLHPTLGTYWTSGCVFIVA
jgi:hypothetical protein